MKLFFVSFSLRTSTECSHVIYGTKPVAALERGTTELTAVTTSRDGLRGINYAFHRRGGRRDQEAS